VTKLAIPDAALAQHVIALGKTGSGKSSKLRLIVEKLLDLQVPTCIVDPKGDWWGLKSSADGKHAGYPVVIFGGEHCDVPLNSHAGAHVAELVATGNRPCIVDLGGWMIGERTRFFIDFAAALFRLTRGPRHLVIDEVHNFAPQGKVLDPDAGKMLHWANRLASEGRGKGLTIIAASQRPQKVHKDFLTSCETLIAGRVIHKLDRDAIRDWIDGCADPTLGKQVLGELANMKRNEAWVWSPEIDFGPERIAFPMFKTFDSFQPQAADAAKLKGWAEVDLEEVKTKLAAVVAEAEANDPAVLRKQLAELQRQLKAKGAPTPEDLKAAEQRGFERSNALAIEAQNALLSKLQLDFESALDGLRKAFLATLGGARSENPVRRVEGRRPAEAFQERRTGTAPSLPRARQIDGRAPINGASEDIGSGGKHRILVALAQQGRPTDQRRLSLLTGLSSRSGTWSTYLSSLRQSGYIEGREALSITPAGLAALGSFEPLPTGPELIEYWRRRLGESGKRAIFDAVIDAYPSHIDQEAVASAASLSARSGTWSTYLSELRGLGLIEGRGELRASEDLFA